VLFHKLIFIQKKSLILTQMYFDRKLVNQYKDDPAQTKFQKWEDPVGLMISSVNLHYLREALNIINQFPYKALYFNCYAEDRTKLLQGTDSIHNDIIISYPEVNAHIILFKISIFMNIKQIFLINF
jgi:hypothetical protein